MSWLPNPFKSLQLSENEESASGAGGGCVKEELSSIGVTIGRQLLSVAAFLAPPPPLQPSPPPRAGSAADECSSDTRSPRLDGIRNDLVEISDSFKSSLSLLSSKKAVTKISKLASNFLRLDEQIGVEEEEDHGVGITDEVVDFVTEISERPECWTDFPLSLNDDDFTMSEAQAVHSSVIEHLVPSLADLRTRLGSEISERKFWIIYFILLLPRLNENSLNLLSTLEIVEARRTLLTMLQHRRNSLAPNSQKDHIDNSSQSDSKFDQKGCGEDASSKNIVVCKNSVASTGVQTDREGTAGKCSEEEDANTASVDAQRQLQNEDDISFSDLEDDDTVLSSRRYAPEQGQDSGSSSPCGSSEWVQLNENAESGGKRSLNRDSQGEESSDWLKIDEFDNYH